MSQYGILNFDPEDPKFYITELDVDTLNFIEKFGFENSREYISDKDRTKLLVKRDIDNIILLLYPQYSGAHFLINCLCLSDDIKISKYLNAIEKSNFFCSQYNTQETYWNDVTLQYQIESDTNYKFYQSHHYTTNVNRAFKFWKNADKIIIFKNASLFCTFRKCISIHSKIILFPEKPPTPRDITVNKLDCILQRKNINLLTYKDLPSNTKKKIQKLFNDKKSTLPQNYSLCKLKTKKQFYFWDVNWFLDEEEFIFNIEKLYDCFELTGFNSQLITKCYHSWMNAMCRTLENNYESGLIK